MPEPEQLLDVLSVLDSQDNPVLNNCTLQLGEVALEFKSGRSKVPLRLAAEVARDARITIPGYSGPVAPPVSNVSAALPETSERERAPETEGERQARIAAAAEYLRSEGMEVPEIEADTEDPEKKALEARIAELEEMVKQAVALAPAGDKEPEAQTETEGEDKPAAPAAETPAEPTIPKGFEENTAGGKPRCWARKADGSQCASPSLEGSHACGMPAHQKLVK